MNLPNAVFTVCLAIGGIFITRNYKKDDQTDKEFDILNKGYAKLDQKNNDLTERICKAEMQNETTADTVQKNFVMHSQSLHAAITRAGETYARRDDLDKVLQKIDAMPDKMESRFRGILDDRDAHKK